VVVNDTDVQKGTLKKYGGSHSDDWINVVACQAANALRIKHSDPETRDKQVSAALAGLSGIGPKDEIEGMMAAQLIAAHNAAMACYRRGLIDEQNSEARRENLV
jgi:hypothetical protein